MINLKRSRRRMGGLPLLDSGLRGSSHCMEVGHLKGGAQLSQFPCIQSDELTLMQWLCVSVSDNCPYLPNRVKRGKYVPQSD